MEMIFPKGFSFGKYRFADDSVTTMLNGSESAEVSPASNGKEKIFRKPGSAKKILSSANFLLS
jgi:hypothetical protein